MQYTKGVCGPKSTNELEIRQFEVSPFGPELVKGYGLMQTRKGLRDISFLAQGKNAKALKPFLAIGAKVDVEVRWTGGHAATITGVEGLVAANSN